MTSVRVTVVETQGYTVAEFESRDEAWDFCRWLQRHHARLRTEYECEIHDRTTAKEKPRASGRK